MYTAHSELILVPLLLFFFLISSLCDTGSQSGELGVSSTAACSLLELKLKKTL